MKHLFFDDSSLKETDPRGNFPPVREWIHFETTLHQRKGIQRREVLNNVLPRRSPNGPDENDRIPVSRCQEAVDEGAIIAAVSSVRYVPEYPCSGQALLIGCCCIPNARIEIVEQVEFGQG